MRGCGDDRRRGELRDRDVIGMAVGAVGPERHDDVGTDAPDVSSDAVDDLAGRGAIELLVVIVEQPTSSRTPSTAAAARSSRLADRRQRTGAGVRLVVWRMAAIPARVASRGSQQGHVDAFRRVLRQRSAEAQRLVVGMRQHGHQSQWRHCSSAP